jgi:tellurite resistance protein TehA-like permease
MTIAALTATQVSQAQWGGHAFTLVAYVLWWVGVGWVFVTALVVITVFIYTGNQMDRVMTPVLFMAPVGLATAGVEAGNITVFGAEMSSRLAVPMLIVGYFAVGVAFFMAIILYTIYFHRLLAAGWSTPTTRAALFILVSSQSSAYTLQEVTNCCIIRSVQQANYPPHFSSWANRYQATTASQNTSLKPLTHQCTAPSGVNKPRRALTQQVCFLVSYSSVLTIFACVSQSSVLRMSLCDASSRTH